MTLTKEQKNGLIQSLYGPMFDYIEAIAEAPKSRTSFWNQLLGKAPNKNVKLTAHLLSMESTGKYEAKARFEARIEAILDAYLEGRVLAESVSESTAVVDGVAEFQEQQKQEFAHALAQIKWKELEDFWFKPAEEKERLWSHYNGAYLLINKVKTFSWKFMQEQEKALGVSWDKICHAPNHHSDEDEIEECYTCASHQAEIARLKAAGEVCFDPKD